MKLCTKLFVLCMVPVLLLGQVSAPAPNPRAGQAANQPTSENSALRDLVSQYYAAYAKKDVDGLMALWSSQSPDIAARRQALEKFFAGNDKIVADNIVIQDAKFEGDKVRLRVQLEMSATDIKSGKPSSESGKSIRIFECVKESGHWKVRREVDAVEDLAAILIGAASEQERAALLEREKELVTTKLANALMVQGRALYKNLPQALIAFTLAQQVADQVGDPMALSAAYRGLGSVHFMKAEHEQALECYQKSLEIAQKVNDQPSIANALIGIGSAQSELVNISSALESYKKALHVAELIADNRVIGMALHNIGAMLRYQGQYAEAQEYLRKALAWKEKNDNDPHGIANTLHDLGALALNQGNYAEALEYHQRALALAEKSDDTFEVAVCLRNIGEILAYADNEEESLAYYRRSLAISEQQGAKENTNNALQDLATLEAEQKDYAAALKDCRRGLELAEASGNKLRISQLLHVMADIYRLRADYPAALDFDLKSLSLAEEMGDQLEIGITYAKVSRDYYGQGKFDRAVEFAESDSRIARSLGVPEELWTARTTAGRAYRALGQTVLARQAFQEAIDAVESMRTDVAGGEEQQGKFFGERISPYEEMVGMLVAQNQAREAWLFSEQAKGKALLDVLHNGRIEITKAMTEVERNQEQQLEGEMTSLNRQIQQEKLAAKPDQERLDGLKSKLEQARLEYNQFEITLYAAHPELRVQRGKVQPLTWEEAAQLLPDTGAAFLEFLVAETKTYLFVTTRNSQDAPELKVYPIGITKEDLARRAEEFRQKLARRDLNIRVSAQQLYDILLKPAQQQLTGKNAIVIVPDGPLWELPFQALEYGNHYLVEKYAIAYVPSLTVLREMMQLRRRSRQVMPVQGYTLLAMADPVLTKETLAHAAIVYRNEKPRALPEARWEVQTLKRLYGDQQTEIYTGSDAREERFKSEAANFRILHLATHSVLDNASPMYSNVLLAPGDTGKEDGLLEAWEIMQMDLKAELAVLSACETARGRITSGEGVIGLSWAFFVAGVPTTVVSQWNVESKSTAELMLAFHRARKANEHAAAPFGTARALQRAELQLLHSPKFSHPAYWAAFIVVGDPQ